MTRRFNTLHALLACLVLVGLLTPASLAETRGGLKGATVPVFADDEGWEVLFDGTSTDAFRGWKSEAFPDKGWVIDGDALHIQANAKAGDIVTKKQYASFDLRFEWKVSKGANSGVIYRCIEHDDVRLSFMSGPEYQILEDQNHINGKNPKTTAASLYAHYAPNSLKTLKPVGQWNTGRVVVRGSKVQHWLNGEIVIAYDLDSEAFAKISQGTHYKQWKKFAKEKVGHIAFQDHNNDVWFRNIKIKELPDPKEDEWTYLFDGTSVEHFRGLNSDVFPEGKWTIDNAALHHAKGGGGDIITKKKFTSFDFQFQWRISEGGNSGIKYRVAETGDPKKLGALGLEYQILDDDKHKDGKIKTHRTGELYDLIEANDKKHVKPVGEWNTSRIVMDKNNVEHWLNGEVVVAYELWSDEFNKILANSKYRNKKEFGKAVPGHIAFQDHGDKVWYREVRIKELDSK